MGSGRRVGIKLNDRNAFGAFCVALSEDDVPFAHAGFQTVVLSKTQLRQLPPHSQKLFEKFEAAGLVDVFPASLSGKRTLTTREEAEKLLEEFTERRVKAR